MKKITTYLLTLTMLSLPKLEANIVENFSNDYSKLEKEILSNKVPQKKNTKNLKAESEIELNENVAPIKIKYLTPREANSIIDSIYLKVKAPKYITKSEFKKIGKIESGNNKFAYNKKSGASGWYQVLPSVFKEFAGEDTSENEIFNPRKNAEASLRLLKSLERINEKSNPYWGSISRKEKVKYILAAYDWGIGNLMENDWDLTKAPTETKNYFKKMYEED